MTWAAITIMLTTPVVYCIARYTLRSDWSAMLALVVAVVWVNFLLAVLL